MWFTNLLSNGYWIDNRLKTCIIRIFIIVIKGVLCTGGGGGGKVSIFLKSQLSQNYRFLGSGITWRLCSVRHPSGAGCSKCLFVRLKSERYDIFVLKSNTATYFVVKRCKYKYWIAYCRCSHVIWIASERKANFHAQVRQCMKICFSFWCNSYGPWTPTKCDSMLKNRPGCLFIRTFFTEELIYPLTYNAWNYMHPPFNKFDMWDQDTRPDFMEISSYPCNWICIYNKRH